MTVLFFGWSTKRTEWALLSAAYKTAIFKLHNPSHHRRAMMKDSMKRAHRAYSKALAAVEMDVKAIASMSKKGRKEPMRRLAQKLADIARPLPLASGAKQAIQLEVMAAAESYLELVAADPATQYPTAGRLSDQPCAYEAALTDIAQATTEGAEREMRDLLATAERPGKVRPLGFYKNRVSDGFLILRDDKGRLFAWLNLHPMSSRFAKAVNVVDMVDVRASEVMSFRSSTGALFPLELGATFHGERFFDKGRPQSARLIERDGTFFLAVTFQFEAEERQPVNVLGVDRGIENIAAWTVVSAAGDVLARGRFEGARLRDLQRQAEAKRRDMQRRGKIAAGRMEQAVNAEIAHTVANAIVAAAIEHNAVVVLEDLENIANGPQHRRNKGARRARGFNRLLSRALYQKLEWAIGYRLACAGFPEVSKSERYLKVGAAGTSITCPVCGCVDKGSRDRKADQTVFRCVGCGHTDHADDNGSRVIALKGLWWNATRANLTKGVKLTEEQKFETFLTNMAAQAAMKGVGSVDDGDSCRSLALHDGTGRRDSLRISSSSVERTEHSAHCETDAIQAVGGVSVTERQCSNRRYCSLNHDLAPASGDEPVRSRGEGNIRAP